MKQSYEYLMVALIYFGLVFGTTMTWVHFDLMEKYSTAVMTLEQKDMILSQVLEENERLTNEKQEVIALREQKLRDDIYNYISTRYNHIPKKTRQEITETLVIKSKEYKVIPELLMGIIEVESGFNPKAVSVVNARGLMQVMPEWKRKFKVKDLSSVEEGIDAGIRVLLIHLKENNHNIKKALFDYVGGDSTYSDMVFRSMGKFMSHRMERGGNYLIDVERPTAESDSGDLRASM